MQKYSKRKPVSWFRTRVGVNIVAGNTASLFTPPIKIESQQHAMALYLSQEKGYRYKEVPNV